MKFALVILFSTLLTLTSFGGIKRQKIDSLQQLIRQSDDSVNTRYYNGISHIFLNSNLDSSRHYSQLGYEHAVKYNLPRETVRALFNIGNVGYLSGDYQLALEKYVAALDIMKGLGDKKGMANAYMGIASVYSVLEENEKAIVHQEKSLELRLELKDTMAVAGAYNNLGAIYTAMKDYDKALEYNFKSLKIKEDRQVYGALSSSYGNIAEIYVLTDRPKLALEYELKALEIRRKVENVKGMVLSYLDLANIYEKLDNRSMAIDYHEKALLLASQRQFAQGISNALISLSRLHESNGDLTKALKYFKRYEAVKDSLAEASKQEKLLKLQTKFETKEKESEIQLLKKDHEIDALKIKENEGELKQKNSLIIAAIIAILGLVFAAYSYFKKLNLKVQMVKELEDKNHLIRDQKELLSRKNEDITDSIEYAKKLQEATLPSEQKISNALDEHFIFHRARDIVSGDFYWLHADKERTVIFVGDCTGHGVPGAFLAITGAELLSRIVIESGISQPGEILKELNKNMQAIFHSEGSIGQSSDGMDCSVCVIRDNEITFSGAKNPLWVVRTSEDPMTDEIARAQNLSLLSIEADRNTIGYGVEPSYRFKEQTFKTSKGDQFFLFSDGYKDQFGGDKGKKFKLQKFKDLILETTTLPIAKQRDYVANRFDEWKQGYGQVDDVCIVSWKL